MSAPKRIWIEAAPQFPEKIPPFPSWNDDEADPSMNQTVEYVRADLCTPTDERVKALEAENARLRETNRRFQRRMQLLEGWWQRRVDRASNERAMYLRFLCQKTGSRPDLRSIEEAAYQRGYSDGYDNQFVIPKRKVKARAALRDMDETP